MNYANPLSLLGNIKSQLKKSSYRKIELSRLAIDLEHVYQRLEKHQYLKFNPHPNHFDIEDRWQEFMVELIFQTDVAHLWSRVLKRLRIEHRHHILDLCPGRTPKVELALHELDFRGSLTLVEKNRCTLHDLMDFMRPFHFAFHIRPLCCNVWQVKGKYDVITANHILDDLILDAGCDFFRLSPHEIYSNEKKWNELWKNILGSGPDIWQSVRNSFIKLLNRSLKSGGYLILTQYPSYAEKIMGGKAQQFFLRRCVSDLSRTLENAGYKNESEKIHRTGWRVKNSLSSRNFFVFRKN